MFPSISRLFLRWKGPKSIAKLDGGPWPDLLPGSATGSGRCPTECRVLSWRRMLLVEGTISSSIKTF